MHLYVVIYISVLIYFQASVSSEVIQEPDPAFNIPTDGSVDSQIAQALLVSNIDTAVKVWSFIENQFEFHFRFAWIINDFPML